MHPHLNYVALAVFSENVIMKTGIFMDRTVNISSLMMAEVSLRWRRRPTGRCSAVNHANVSSAEIKQQKKQLSVKSICPVFLHRFDLMPHSSKTCQTSREAD